MTEIRTIYCDGCNNKLESVRGNDYSSWLNLRGKNDLCYDCEAAILDFIQKRKLQVKV